MKRATAKVKYIDYTKRVIMPIRDFERDGQVVFEVVVYGVDPRDLAMIPGGSEPMLRAVTRMGLDPDRYQAVIWDIPMSRR